MEYLNDKGIIMEQPETAYRFSGDSVALGNFVRCKRINTVMDIGCGTGVLSLLIAGNMMPKRIIAVDINKDACLQAEKNIRLNDGKFSTVCEVYNADIREFYKQMGAVADVIVCNPPYFVSGKKSENPNVQLARHDDTLSLSELAEAATRLLKYGGTIYFCYPANQTARATAIFENNNFRVKEMKFLSNDKGVYLTLFRCKKGGGHNTIVKC